MNTQHAAAKFVLAFVSYFIAAFIILRSWAVKRFSGVIGRGADSGAIQLRYLAPLLLCGLVAAMPAHAGVTQSPSTVVAPGTAVEYLVTTGKVPVNGNVTIAVQDNNVDIVTQLLSPDQSCSDAGQGLIYCNTNGSYPLDWTPPSGVNNLQFTANVYDSDGILTNQVTGNLTTAVGNEALQLQISANPATYTKVGEVITYTYEISNTGSLDLGAVSVTDSRLESIGSCKFRLIVAGAPPVTCSQVYSVTQADLDAGSLVSSAQVSASSLYGSSPIVANGQVTVTAGVNSTLQLQITADPATYTEVGDNITFTYTLTNSGNVDLSGVVVTDSDSGATISGCGSSLSVGASTSCTETYSITQADITDGSLSKNGKAVASTPGGSTGSGGVQATAKISVSKAGASGAPASSAPVDFTTLPNLTPNQGAIAGSLNSLCLTSTNQTVQTQCNNLYSLSTSQLQTALQQLVPDQVAAQGANAVETSFTQLSNVRWRLGALHNNSGSNMLALSGLMLAVNDQSVPVGLLADAAGDSANIANSGRLGGFVNGRIQLGANGTTANAAGYDFTTKGVTAGIDYRLSDQLVLGGALGYANSKNDYSSSRGDMSSDGTTFSFYGSYYAPRDIYLDWIASYGSNKYNSTRNIVYSNVNTQTQGDTNGRQLGASVSLGSDLARGAWLFTPYVRAEYVEAKVNAYDESGGGGLALSYDEQTVRSFVSAAAARVARAISTSSGVYTPSAHLEWEHQYRNDQRLITARFVEDPSAPFQITTDSPDRNYFDLGLAVAATWPAGRSGFISYETVLGQTNIRDYTIDFGVRQEF